MKKDINEILTTKKQKYLVGVTILLLLVAVGMFSYAFTGNINYVGLNTNKISNCSIDLSFKDSNPIKLADTFPMNYEKVQEYDPYTFYIKNNSTSCDMLTYKIDMASICDTCGTESCDLGDGNTCNCNEEYQFDETLINYELKNVATGQITRGTINEFHIEKILGENTTDTYEMRMWIDESATQSDVYVNGDSSLSKNYCGKLNIEVVADKLECDPMPVEESNANAPVLASNMIPVCYNSEKDMWLKADSTNADTGHQWYSYSGKTWANAVTVTEENRQTYLDAKVGTPISMDDINTMLVWIPRFSATMTEGQAGEYTETAYCSDETYTSESDCKSAGETWYPVGYNNPGAFNITFVNKETTAHDAFTFGNEVSGFWMGKFENSSDIECLGLIPAAVGEGCNLTTIHPKVIPNANIWVGGMVSTYFYNIQKMTESGNQYGFDKIADSTLDTHMLKNNEWGAVVYLTQSIYGRCTSSTSCTKIASNEFGIYGDKTTGYGSLNVSGATQKHGTYETALGMDASTTGNIYGIYDMNGEYGEYVMGVYWDGTKLWSGLQTGDTESIRNQHSGFNGWLENDSKNYTNGVAYPSDNKYYNLYTTESAYTSLGQQHAMLETSGWYGGKSDFVSSTEPWIFRGYGYKNLFSYDSFNGNAFALIGAIAPSSRTSIIIN